MNLWNDGWKLLEKADIIKLKRQVINVEAKL